MIELKKIQSIYMLGIGGIGMSALARYFHLQGVKVSGYDKTPSELTDELINEGIEVHFDEDTSKVPKNAVYVYTPAIPAEHPAFEHVNSQGGAWIKRSELLELVTQQTKTIAIAGTHGKTTTTAITSHILHEVFGNISAFVGGVMAGYDSNLIATNHPEWIVVEADEFDRSFLRLQPEIAVITSLDPDHLDIYGSFEQMKEDYRAFARKANRLIVHERISHEFDHPNMVTYGIGATSDFAINSIEVTAGQFKFDVAGRGNFVSTLPGRHNIENATAAIAVAVQLQAPLSLVELGLASFKGVKRRFEKIIESEGMVLIDDYAHHPEEIKSAIGAARELYPKRNVLVVFQPHLFTRTKDLEDGFVSSLSLADQVVLLPIYPARELPIEGVSSANLLKKLTLKTKLLVEKSDLLIAVLSLPAEVILFLGAGDIDRFVKPMADALKLKMNVE